MPDIEQALVVDNGGGELKVGFAGDDTPTASFPTILGHDATGDLVNFFDLSTSDGYSEFKNKVTSGTLKLSYPIRHGAITNWEFMEKLWNHAFSNELKVDPREYNLLITEASHSSKPHREKMAEILFEKFNFSALSIVPSAVLPLYSAGKSTGIVLESGDGVTQAVPVWGGYTLPEAILRLDLGGRDLDEFLLSLLKEENSSMNLPIEIIRLIKENGCFVSQDVTKEPAVQNSYELPDGTKVKMSKAHLCPELLFTPSLMEAQESSGVHELVYKSILKTNVDIRKDLYSNIVLSGGCTLFPGFAERLEKEIKALAPPGAAAKVKLEAKPERKNAVWYGGSILATLSNFQNQLVSKKEYEDTGASILHMNKC